MSHVQFRALLEEGDVDGLVRGWRELFPGMPQPASREQAEIVMHRARTEAASITLRARAYSHRWLTERNFPSGLPDRLKPSAERLYPRRVAGVGISVNTRSPILRPAMIEVRKAMEGAVLEAEADGRLTDDAFVATRMAAAKDRELRALFGSSALPSTAP